MRYLHRDHAATPFAGYLDEILAVEGFLGCERLDLTGRMLTADLLDGQDLVLLGQMPLERAEQEIVDSYVRGGGRLIAIRPPIEMAPLFGLQARNVELKRGHYVHFAADGCPSGALSTEVPLQVHAAADGYEVKGAEVAARFCWGNGAVRHLPAVASSNAGDGVATMFSYDLAASTVLFHQGLADQASTGAHPDPGAFGQYKPDGHFVGHLDVTRATIPQADLQQRMLGALVDRMLPTPYPRLWYSPEGEPCLAFLNGDSDSMRLDDLDGVLEIVERGTGRYTCYVMDEEPLSADDESSRRARGHSFGKHIWTGPKPSLEAMSAAVGEQIAGYREHYGYTPLTNRGHCLIWPGWTEMAQYLSDAGVRMDSNFVGAHCGHGYLTGSGLPVKFMDENGRMIDLYEQSTQWEDDVAIAEYCERLSYDQAVSHSLETLREARERYHTMVNFNFHPIHIRKEYLQTREWITAVVQWCRQQRVPMVDGDGWARYNDARRQVTMTNYSAGAGTVRFSLNAREPVLGLTVTLPTEWNGASAATAVADGQSLPTARRAIHGQERLFAWLDLNAGESRQISITYAAQ